MKMSKCAIKPPCPELRGSLAGMKYPAMIEIKSDGEFCFVHVGDNAQFTINKYGTVREGFAELQRLAGLVKITHCHTSATFLGELCVNDGRAGELYTLLSNKDNDAMLQIYVFDIIELDGKDLRNEPLISRKEILVEMLQKEKFIAHFHMVHNEADVKANFEKATKAGYEGIVVKRLDGKLVLDTCDWVKVKYKDRTDYRVSIVDNTQERIEVEVPVVYTQGSKIVHVGVKCPQKYKQFIKVGDLCTVEYQGVLASGSLRHPVLIAKSEWK